MKKSARSLERYVDPVNLRPLGSIPHEIRGARVQRQQLAEWQIMSHLPRIEMYDSQIRLRDTVSKRWTTTNIRGRARHREFLKLEKAI